MCGRIKKYKTLVTPGVNPLITIRYDKNCVVCKGLISNRKYESLQSIIERSAAHSQAVTNHTT